MILINLYVTTIPLIVSGILNMIFTKTTYYKSHRYPIDNYKTINNHRIFGDNKTIVGFVSMVIFTAMSQILWGIVCDVLNMSDLNDWYNINKNTILYNLQTGSLIGFTYMICELPNSFIKRAIGISPGEHTKSITGYIFFIIDQMDSLIGVFLLLIYYSDITIQKYLIYILIGAVTHIVINYILIIFKIRRRL